MSTTALGFGTPILPVTKSCACGRQYTVMGWRDLPLLGVQHLGGTGRGEMRQCACNSTLLLPMGGKPTIRMSAVDERVLLDIEAAVGGRR